MWESCSPVHPFPPPSARLGGFGSFLLTCSRFLSDLKRKGQKSYWKVLQRKSTRIKENLLPRGLCEMRTMWYIVQEGSLEKRSEKDKCRTFSPVLFWIEWKIPTSFLRETTIEDNKWCYHALLPSTYLNLLKWLRYTREDLSFYGHHNSLTMRHGRSFLSLPESSSIHIWAI